MSDDISLGSTKIKGWGSSSESGSMGGSYGSPIPSIGGGFDSSGIPRYAPPSLQAPDSSLGWSNIRSEYKELGMPKNKLSPISTIKRKDKEPALTAETKAPAPPPTTSPTITAAPNAKIDSENPLGEIKKVKPTPPGFAPVAKLGKSKSTLTTAKVSPPNIRLISTSPAIPKLPEQSKPIQAKPEPQAKAPKLQLPNVKSESKQAIQTTTPQPIEKEKETTSQLKGDYSGIKSKKSPDAKKIGPHLSKMAIGVLISVLFISLTVGVIYIVMTSANTTLGTITLTASPSGGLGPYTYIWSVGNGCGSPIAGQTGNTLIINNAGSVAYSVQITDSEQPTPAVGCVNYSV